MAWLLLVVPLVAAATVGLAHRHRGALLPLSFAGATATLVTGCWAAATEPSGSWRWSDTLELGLAVEGLARVMVVLVPAVAVPVIAFGASSMRTDVGLARLLGLLLCFVGAMLVLVAARDLLTLLVAWEVVGALSWGLIAHDWREPDRSQRAAHAFLTTRAGDLGLVAAAGVAVAALGTASYRDLASLEGWQVHAVAGGLLVAAAAKSAQLPFSPWLFSAMAGPSPVSALLHSATMVAAGAYALARIVPALPGATWLAGAVAGVGLATALAGGVVAAVQTDLKRALAASTSAQYGLIFVAVGAGSTAAAATHLVTHATFKALLFLCAGVVLHTAGTLDLSRLRLGRSLRVTALTFTVGALALAAVPPLGGARSKESILAAALHDSAWLGVGVFLAAFLSALYAGRLATLTFGFGAEPTAVTGQPRPVEHATLVSLAGASTALGALWLPGADRVVAAVTGDRLVVGDPSELAASLGAILAAGIAIVGLHRAGHLVTLALPEGAHEGLAGWFGLPTLAKVLVVDPVLALAAALSAFDDRVIDAGVRFAARVPRTLSRSLSWWGERSIDGTVQGVAAVTMHAAAGSRRVDEGGIDGAVEQLARGAGVAGTRSRQLQTGLAHHYYVIAAVGLVVLVAITAIGR